MIEGMGPRALGAARPVIVPMERALLKKALILGLVFVLVGGLGALTLQLTDRDQGTPYTMVGAPLSLLGIGPGVDDYQLTDLRYLKIAATKVTTDYVDPDRVEPVRMLRGALDAVARDVPEFLYRFEGKGDSLRLVFGLSERELPVGSLDGVPALAELLGHVATFLDEHLGEDRERREIEYAMMNGMLRTLDPHSFFIDPDAYEEMGQDQRGHFGGLGITIGIQEGRLTVLYPMPDTPAWRAGVKAGDRIDKIGNESTVNMELGEAVDRLRGEVGTQIEITLSDDDGPPRELTMTRDRIEQPSLKYAYAGAGVGYVQVQHFHRETYDRLEDALSDLDTRAIQEEHGGLEGLILDLRGNPGGFLEQAYLMADKFLRSGPIVSTEGFAGTAREQKSARPFGTEDDLPLVVLVDAGSASASEIVAGALQNLDRAVIMGTRTFGKGSVQNLYERNFDNGALKLTIARYLTPGDISIQGIGIQPDVEIRPALTSEEDGDLDVRLYWEDFELREEDLDGAFDWGQATTPTRHPTFVISCPECWEDPTERSREMTAADNLRLPQVQAAKALLIEAGNAKASQMLAAVPAVVPKVLRERENALVDWFASHDIDWTPAPAGHRGNGALGVELEVGSDDGKLQPGASTDVTLALTNTGPVPLYRLRAVTQGDFFEGREYVFGRLDPGETRRYTVAAHPRLWLSARTEEVRWHFYSDGPVEMPEPFVGRLAIDEVPRPRFAYSWSLVDDGSGASEGNGDGLLQPGETVEMVVTVRNIGEGGTSDLYRAEHGLLDPGEDADGDGVPDRPSGFLRLKNTTGPALFLEEGVSTFSLEAGGTQRMVLRFRVGDDVGGLDELTAELRVGDDRFLDVVTQELIMPLRPAAGSVAAMERLVKARGGGPVVLRGGADASAPVVAHVDGAALVDGQLGGWVRTPLPWGGYGWAEGETVVPARGDIPTKPELFLAHSPPVIVFDENPGGSVVSADFITLQGRVLDDVAVKDLFVFVRDPETRREQKISYERLETPTKEHRFSLTLPLHPTVNEIELFTRDDQDLLGSRTLSLYRETATAANKREAGAVEGTR